MLNLKTEQKTKWILSGIILVSLLGYIFASFGKASWLVYTSAGFGILLGLLIIGEVGFVAWLNRSGYKTISVGDFMVIAGGVLGGAVILNSLFIIQAFRNLAPAGLLSFLNGLGLILTGVAGIVALALIFTSKPKA